MNADDTTPAELDGPDINPGNRTSGSSRDARNANESQFTRREFVSIVGAVTGGIALRIPNNNNVIGISSPSMPAQVELTQATRFVPVELRINGRMQKWSIDPRVTLLDLLRDNAGLTGTKKGCDHGQCGACTVLVNGIRINSCLSLAVTHDRDEITTIEGLAEDGQLNALQAAFVEHDGFQCGYCTPGQICSAVALLREARNGDLSAVTQDLAKTGPAVLSAPEIRERMSGNICRCGAYPGIVEAIQAGYAQSDNTPTNSRT